MARAEIGDTVIPNCIAENVVKGSGERGVNRRESRGYFGVTRGSRQE